MDFLKRRLADYSSAGRYRRLQPVVERIDGRVVLAAGDDRPLLDFSSNDYLGLSQHPELIKASCAALERYGTGVGAARLMSGDLALFHQLEGEVAEFKGCAAALLFGSGYMANVGIIPALVGRHDVIFSDRLNHASIHDGCRLSGARLVRFRHNDMEQLDSLLREKRGGGRALLVVESIYSMDGDRAPLAALAELKERYRCLLMVDEAHATGVYGANGGGVIEEEGMAGVVDLAMGTFGKALGSYGAYVAADRTLIDYLVNRARSFIFSTAPPPAVAAASLAAVRLVQERPSLRSELREKVVLFKKALVSGGIAADLGSSQIVPIVLGQSGKTVAAARRLRERGFYVTAVRPPTVPEGTARLRFSVTRNLERGDLLAAAAALSAFLSGKEAE